jgi:hypothetical protein
MYQIIKRTFIIIFVFLVLLTTYCLPNSVSAEGVALKITPANLTIRAMPPADVRTTLILENTSLQEHEFRIVLKRFTESGEDLGKLEYTGFDLTKPVTQDAFLKKIRILDADRVIDRLTLGPKQKKELELSLPLSKDEKLQDHYFSLVFVSEPVLTLDSNEEEKISYSVIKAALALPILVSIGQNSQQSGFIKAFSAPFFLESGPVPFAIEVENQGEHFITARGVILIKNMFGQTVGRVDIPATNILTDSSRKLMSKEQLTKSQSEAKVLWPEKFLLGFYSATLSLAVSPEQSLYTRTVYFISFPFSLLIVSLVIIIFLLVTFRKIKKRVSEE